MVRLNGGRVHQPLSRHPLRRPAVAFFFPKKRQFLGVTTIVILSISSFVCARLVGVGVFSLVHRKEGRRSIEGTKRWFGLSRRSVGGSSHRIRGSIERSPEAGRGCPRRGRNRCRDQRHEARGEPTACLRRLSARPPAFRPSSDQRPEAVAEDTDAEISDTRAGAKILTSSSSSMLWAPFSEIAPDSREA